MRPVSLTSTVAIVTLCLAQIFGAVTTDASAPSPNSTAPPPDGSGNWSGPYTRNIILPNFNNISCSCTILNGNYVVSFWQNKVSYGITTNLSDGYSGYGHYSPSYHNGYTGSVPFWNSRCNVWDSAGAYCRQWEWQSETKVHLANGVGGTCDLWYNVFINWDGYQQVTQGGDPNAC